MIRTCRLHERHPAWLAGQSPVVPLAPRRSARAPASVQRDPLDPAHLGVPPHRAEPIAGAGDRPSSAVSACASEQRSIASITCVLYFNAPSAASRALPATGVCADSLEVTLELRRLRPCQSLRVLRIALGRRRRRSFRHWLPHALAARAFRRIGTSLRTCGPRRVTRRACAAGRRPPALCHQPGGARRAGSA